MRIAAALQLQGQHHVFQRGEVGQQLKALKYKTQFGGAYSSASVFVDGENVHATQANRTAAGRVQAGNQCEQCAFSRARCAHDGSRLAGLQSEANFMKYGECSGGIANLLGDGVDFNDGF